MNTVRAIWVSIALALILIGTSCTPEPPPAAQETTQNEVQDSARIGTVSAALTTSVPRMLWRDFDDGGCVCAGVSGGGYSFADVSVGTLPIAKTFADPVPAGSCVTGVTVDFGGSGCGTPASFLLNGTNLGQTNDPNACDCSACDISSVTYTLAAGVPGYVYGGTNTFTFTAPTRGYALSYSDLTLTYAASAATTTTLASATNPSVFGQSVTFTAHVTSPSGAPTGTVDFKEGAAVLATVAVNGAGDAIFTTAASAVGSHSVTAAYSGDGCMFPASASAALAQVVNKAATTTTLASSQNPSIINGSVTLTATVAPTAPGAGTPTGNVAFKDGATTIGTAAVDGAGQAMLTSSALAVGSHTLTAVFAGDTSFATSTSTNVVQVVNQDGNTTTLASDVNPSLFGGSVTFTATVSTTSTGGTPTGNVVFKDGAATLGTVALAAGVASYTTAALTGGSHSVSATYAGDTNHAPGAAATVVQIVDRAATTTTVASSANPSKHGQSVTFTATVASGVAGALTGNVVFTDGGVTIGTSAIAAGVATLTTSVLATASHDIVATYGGNTNFATSASSTVAQVVDAASTTTTLIASTNPGVVGVSITFTATVATAAPGAGTVTGTVTFKDGATVLGTGTLAAGVTTFATSALTVGTHPITAVFEGSTDSLTSTSATLSEVVNANAASGKLVSAPNPSIVKSPVTLTATLTGDAGAPTGQVSFVDVTNDAGTALGTSGLDGGVAAISVTTLEVGNRTVVAQYGGDTFYGATTASVAHVVGKAPTTTVVTSSLNPSSTGDAVTLTATVTSAVAGVSGNVDFTDGTTKLGSAALSAAGVATFKAASFLAGGHVISAAYAGDALHATSTSAILTQNVGQDAGANTVTDGGADSGITPPATGSAEGGDAGCGCHTVPSTGAPAGALGAIVGLALLVARRRRNAR